MVLRCRAALAGPLVAQSGRFMRPRLFNSAEFDSEAVP